MISNLRITTGKVSRRIKNILLENVRKRLQPNMNEVTEDLTLQPLAMKQQSFGAHPSVRISLFHFYCPHCSGQLHLAASETIAWT